MKLCWRGMERQGLHVVIGSSVLVPFINCLFYSVSWQRSHGYPCCHTALISHSHSHNHTHTLSHALYAQTTQRHPRTPELNKKKKRRPRKRV
ncbi:hypothetical protein M431DRAFT_174324 [Trichoderma harzianum CBS 226.95]|uniref:Uncharacterized protein n=1 Tax=Trichoderma harzianum CBS 226.95 TaxID=983964 RepID=A0A2T4AT16_TRIHA|nr:hypothetical protein M431DRAFT_174324 [Trichoderma harzianum CBS 226.95]PTB60224.1 hypothetical protein M431DRAFT_174324 [Trichoderma harzianum CBS 226.95]